MSSIAWNQRRESDPTDCDHIQTKERKVLSCTINCTLNSDKVIVV